MKIKDIIFKSWIYISGIIVVVVTFGVFLYFLYKGIKVVTLEFILEAPGGMPLGTEGGVFPAIMGSLMSGLLSGLIGGLLGLCTSIYLVFYCNNKKNQKYMLHALQLLAGIPSVIIGLFGYTVLIVGLGLNKSLISVTLTLTVMIIPFIALRMKKALEETSKDQFICSLSLGIPKGYTIIHLVIPNALKYIMTSLGLGIVFAMGATAPIMFTGAVIIAGVPNKLTDPIMALPYHLYVLVNEGISIEMAYGTAFVLIVLVLLINLICHFIGNFEDV
ncbi:MAG: ABC transporter permease subunit [Tissierellia bacterium]|nr:ABC transporter permease subunit [Tissierellia bacterium]